MASQSHGSHKSSPRRRSVVRTPLRFDHLEDRVTPAQFTAQTALTFPAGTMNNNGCVATADFNKDGRMDAVVTNYGTNENNNDGTTIVQLMGRATPGFNVRTYSTSATGTSSNVSFVTVADINGDTWPDVIVCNGNQQGIGSVSVFKNDANGLGTLTLQNSFPTGGNNASWVGTADFTGDGILDIAVAHFGKTTVDTNGEQNVQGNMITVFQGNAASGQGDFTFNGPIATLAPTVQGVVAMVPTALALADFDGDGFVDIVAVSPGIPEEVGAPYPEGKVYQFKGNGVGGFAEPNQIDTGGIFPVNVQAADVDGDGDKDLVVANSGDPGPLNSLTYAWTGNSVAVLRNFSTPGSITFDFAEPLTVNLRGPFATAVADFNLDGRADIAAVNYGAPVTGFSNPVNSFVTVYLGSTTVPGQFTTASPAQYDTLTGGAGGQYLAVGNFGGSAAPDLIVVHDNNRVGLLINDSTPASSAPTVAGVTVNGGGDQRSMVRSIAVTFSGPVTFANNNAAAAFTLTRLTNGGGSVGLSAAVSTDGQGRTVVTLTFTGTTAVDLTSALNNGQLSLDDGRFQLSIADGAVTGQGGAALDGDGNGTAGGAYLSPTDTSGGGAGQLRLFRLFGDATGNGVVDLADLGVFRGTFNADINNSLYLEYLDADHSGTVDLADLGEFRSRFNATVF